MLETELGKERDVLTGQVEELRPKADDLKQKEVRLRHIEALLGIKDSDAELEARQVDFEQCCQVVCCTV